MSNPVLHFYRLILKCAEGQGVYVDVESEDLADVKAKHLADAKKRLKAEYAKAQYEPASGTYRLILKCWYTSQQPQHLSTKVEISGALTDILPAHLTQVKQQMQELHEQA